MLWVCVCGSAYSVGAPHCPECGACCDMATERDDMARVNVHGSPTDRLRPELVRFEGSEDLSPGSNSSASPESAETAQSKSEQPARKRAGKTASHSSKG